MIPSNIKLVVLKIEVRIPLPLGLQIVLLRNSISVVGIVHISECLHILDLLEKQFLLVVDDCNSILRVVRSLLPSLVA